MKSKLLALIMRCKAVWVNFQPWQQTPAPLGAGSLLYLRHILDAVQRIESYIAGITCEKFLENDMMQAAVIREMEIIGEAAKRLSPDFKTGHPGIPWRKMAGMRDKLVHDYMGVDIDAVWDTVDRDLPALKSAIIKIVPVNGNK